MSDLKKEISKLIPLTLGEVIKLAEDYNADITEVIIKEAELQTGLDKKEIVEEAYNQFSHNYKAVDIGLTTGESLLFGTIGEQLNSKKIKLFEDDFINKVLVKTLAAQVGNHSIGLQPCAGTGDSCPYTGLLMTMEETGYDKETVSRIACLILKIGSLFRVGKTTTGCNMEGFGAGATALAAAIASLKNASPREIEKAMVLALSPTIANPCTPRVMVPGLCATHIGGAVLIGHLSAGLAVTTDIEVNVPIDVMLAMAADVHPISAKSVVPAVIKYMEPFFKRKEEVESLIDDEIKEIEEKRIEETFAEAKNVSKKLAKGSKPIIETLGEAVVGGSSQAVGSPTNAGRIAHYLTSGKIKKIKIELYPELFARRGINVPGILMGAIFGSSTSDYKSYNESVNKAKEMGIEVSIIQADEHQVQRITIETDKGTAMVDTLNRGGGRLVLRDAMPSYNKGIDIANELGIVLVD